MTSDRFGILYGLIHHVALANWITSATAATVSSGRRRSPELGLRASALSDGRRAFDDAPAEYALLVVKHN